MFLNVSYPRYTVYSFYMSYVFSRHKNFFLRKVIYLKSQDRTTMEFGKENYMGKQVNFQCLM